MSKMTLFMIGLLTPVAFAGNTVIDPGNVKVKIIEYFGDKVITNNGTYLKSDLAWEVPEYQGLRQGSVVLTPQGQRRIVSRVYEDGRIFLVLFMRGTTSTGHAAWADQLYHGKASDLMLRTKVIKECVDIFSDDLELPPYDPRYSTSTPPSGIPSSDSGK